MKLKLKTKVLGLSIASGLLPAVLIMVVLIVSMSSSAKKIVKENEEEAKRNIAGITNNLVEACTMVNVLINNKLDLSISMMSDKIKDAGGASFSGPAIQWQAINQVSKESKEIVLPSLKIGGINYTKTTSLSERVPIVDELAKMHNSTFTIFQRMNQHGDLIRIATNVATLDGKRAVNLYSCN